MQLLAIRQRKEDREEGGRVVRWSSETKSIGNDTIKLGWTGSCLNC